MVVVGMMAVLMTVAFPFMKDMLNRRGMARAVADVTEACSHARAQAILNGVETALVIRPGDRQLSVMPAGRGGGLGSDRLFSPSVSGEEWRMEEAPSAPASGGMAAFSVRLPDTILIEGLGVNGEDWTEDEEARVRFYPNGTCDEMSIVLLSDKMERRNIWLEVVTALAEVETDPEKFRAR
jgi:type II secretory pathway pseudopilin PulG